MVDILDLKNNFGIQYSIELESSYKLEKAELKDPIEWYYTIPAKHGHFYLYGGNTLAFYCIANRIKGVILRRFKEEVTLFVEGEDESVLHFDKSLFSYIAPIAKAKRRRGRKALSEIEKKRLVGAGKSYRFTGKSLQYTELEEKISLMHDRKAAS